MERMARFSRILLWKVLVSLSPDPISRLSSHSGSTGGVCGGIGPVLLPSPFFSCGIDALQEPFGNSGSLRGLQPDAFRLRLRAPAESPLSSPQPVLVDVVSPGKPPVWPGDPTGATAAEDNVGDPFAAEEGHVDRMAFTDLGSRDITGLPNPPPTLDVDLEDEKGEKEEEQAWGPNKPLDLGRGPAQTPEPVAAQPPPLMPSPGEQCGTGGTRAK